jgi:hypothetical protein
MGEFFPSFLLPFGEKKKMRGIGCCLAPPHPYPLPYGERGDV